MMPQFGFFSCHFFSVLVLRHILAVTETFIIIGEESGLLWFKSSDRFGPPRGGGELE